MTTPQKQYSHIVGRDDFISAAWDMLSAKSLYMNDLRRIGKTEIIRKMHDEGHEGWIASFADLEGTHTVEEFVALVCRKSVAALPGKKPGLRKLTTLLGKAAGAEILGIGILKLPDGKPAPWKDVLRTMFDDMAEALGKVSGTRMVFLWDEVPYLLENISKRQGKDMAMEVLDLLRELSQRHDSIRLLLTGSIGIHHVLRSLWEEGYRGSPLNHMDLIQPGPLAPEDAVSFAAGEIVRRGLSCDIEICAAALSDLASHVPFYIEKLVARLPTGVPLTPQCIEAGLDAELRSVQSDWDLEYYRRRVTTVFRGTEKLVLAALDCIATGSAALSFQEIRRLVSVRMETDEEVLRDHLKLLCMDHYLVRDDANAYRFYLPLIRRWWRISRSL